MRNYHCPKEQMSQRVQASHNGHQATHQASNPEELVAGAAALFRDSNTDGLNSMTPNNVTRYG